MGAAQSPLRRRDREPARGPSRDCGTHRSSRVRRWKNRPRHDSSGLHGPRGGRRGLEEPPGSQCGLTKGRTPHDRTMVKCHCGSVSSLWETLSHREISSAGDLFGLSAV